MKVLQSVLGLFFIFSFFSTTTAHAAQKPFLNVTVLNPVSDIIPQGAQRVDVLALSFSASCEAPVHVGSITLHHSGLGSPADIESIALWDGSVRVSPSVSPESQDGDVTIRPRRIFVPACGSTTLIARARMAEDAAIGGEHKYRLLSGDDVRTTNAVTVSIASPSSNGAATVTPSIHRSELMEATMLPVSGSVTYGAGRIVARLQLRSTGSMDQRVTSVTLKNRGSAKNTDLRSLVLLDGKNLQVSSVLPTMNGDSITFIVEPPVIFQGTETRLFKVRADVRASRKRTIDFTVEDPSDVEAQVCTGARPCARAY